MAGGMAACAVARDRDLRGRRAVAGCVREKILSETRLVQLKGLHRSTFRQFFAQAERRGGHGRENPVENATCETERVAQVDITTDSGAATCTGRHSDRFLTRKRRGGPLSGRFRPRDLHRSIFRQIFCPWAVSRARFPTDWLPILPLSALACLRLVRPIAAPVLVSLRCHRFPGRDTDRAANMRHLGEHIGKFRALGHPQARTRSDDARWPNCPLAQPPAGNCPLAQPPLAQPPAGPAARWRFTAVCQLGGRTAPNRAAPSRR